MRVWLPYSLIAAVIGPMVALLSAHGQDGDPALTDRFLREAPSQWEEYTRRVKQLQGTFGFGISNSLADSKARSTFSLRMNGAGKLIDALEEQTIKGKKDY